MAHGRSILKVPGGKLLKIYVQHEDNVIVKVTISGDFFAYPEESISKIEAALHSVPLTRETIIQKTNEVVEQSGAELYGFSPDDLADAILDAARE